MSLERAVVLDVGGYAAGDADAVVGIVRDALSMHDKAIVVVSAPLARRVRDAQTSNHLGPSADLHARAMVLSSGAVEAAERLASDLSNAGIVAGEPDPRGVVPVTRGHALDAEPRRVSATRHEKLLNEADVLVVPGGMGVDDLRRPTWLGDGGSRLSAVFIAATFALPLLVTPGREAPPTERTAWDPAGAHRKAQLRAIRSGVRVRLIEPTPAIALGA